MLSLVNKRPVSPHGVGDLLLVLIDRTNKFAKMEKD